MKKIIWITLLSAFVLAGCEDNNEFITKEAPAVSLDITSIASVDFNDEVTITGTATSANAVRDISFYLVRKAADSYERLWFSPLQYADIQIEKSVPFEMKMIVDDPDAEAIAVSVSDPYGLNTVTYIPIENINGSPSGSAYVFKDMELTAEYEHAGTTPYVFSLEGVKVDGAIKNVLTLDEVKKTGARNLDFVFTNVWRNTTRYTAGVLGNWGYAFCEFRQLARGGIGRQCDFIYVTGKESIPAKTDTCCMVLVSNSIANANNFEQVFLNAGNNYGTSNFLNVLTNLFNANAIGNQYAVNMKTNASGVNTTACKEIAGAGSYIAFRKTRNKTEQIYGLIQIVEMPDVSDALDGTGLKYMPEPYADNIISNANLPQKWYNTEAITATGIAKLYGKKVKVNIIAQKEF